MRLMTLCMYNCNGDGFRVLYPVRQTGVGCELLKKQQEINKSCVAKKVGDMRFYSMLKLGSAKRIGITTKFYQLIKIIINIT